MREAFLAVQDDDEGPSVLEKITLRDYRDLLAELERLRAHIQAFSEWDAKLRNALDALIESLPYDCAGPAPGCGGTCPPCRVQVLLT